MKMCTLWSHCYTYVIKWVVFVTLFLFQFCKFIWCLSKNYVDYAYMCSEINCSILNIWCSKFCWIFLLGPMRLWVYAWQCVGGCVCVCAAVIRLFFIINSFCFYRKRISSKLTEEMEWLQIYCGKKRINEG